MSHNSVRTIADIARLAGVSKSTVSRALSDSSLISNETKARIKKIAAAHNYQVHQAARSLSLQRSNTIGFVLLTDIHYYAKDPFIMDMVGHISNILVDYRYDLLMIQTDQPDQLANYLASKRVDGLIILTNNDYNDVLHALAQEQAPFIAWYVPNPGQSYSAVNCDNVAGGKMATQHLLDLGCQHIGYVAGHPSCPEAELRYQGYCQALEAAGHPVNPSRVVHGDLTIQSGHEAMRRLLAQAPDVDGIFFYSDWMAVGALEVLRNSGRRVPQDVCVIGFDDITLAAYCSPPLTTIRQNIALGAQLLVENLMKYIDTGEVTRTTLPVELIIRESCRSKQ